MSKFLAEIEIDEGELEAIFKEMEAAKETIYRCYDRLRELGLVTIKKEAASGN